MALFSAFVSGLLIGLGLLVSGMADPARVIAFLDVAGSWDPALLLVMAGAVGVSAVGFALARKTPQTPLSLPRQWPTAKTVDVPLIAGALLFGIGWGMAGVCPGPALIGMAMGKPAFWLFGVGLFAGMLLFSWWDTWRKRSGGMR